MNAYLSVSCSVRPVFTQAAAVTAMKCPRATTTTRATASTSQHALLWLPSYPLSRTQRGEGPRRSSWKQQERCQTGAAQSHKDRIRTGSALQLNPLRLSPSAQLSESPLVAVMSHLLTFLEQYSHFQQLQQQADQYRVQLKRHRVQHRRQMKALRASYRQRLKDKNSIICSLEEAVSQTPSPMSDGEESPRGRRGNSQWGEGPVSLRAQHDRVETFITQVVFFFRTFS